MNHHPDNRLFHALKSMASPLDVLETEARNNPQGAHKGSLFVLARRDGSFIYCWGDAEISRREAALRAEGRAA